MFCHYGRLFLIGRHRALAQASVPFPTDKMFLTRTTPENKYRIHPATGRKKRTRIHAIVFTGLRLSRITTKIVVSITANKESRLRLQRCYSRLLCPSYNLVFNKITSNLEKGKINTAKVKLTFAVYMFSLRICEVHVPGQDQIQVLFPDHPFSGRHLFHQTDSDGK